MRAIQEYLDEEGRSPFARWFVDLDATAAAKITATLSRLEQENFSEVRRLGDGVAERRIHSGPGYRIYFGEDGTNLVILLAGGDKGSQRRDIAKAKARWRDYRRRKGVD